MMAHEDEPLFVEIDVSSGGDVVRAASSKSAAKAQRARGFDPSAALRAIGDPSGNDRSACTTRGDGQYQNGSSILQTGNVCHIGPEAFKEGNVQQTLKELEELGAFAGVGRKEEVAPRGGADAVRPVPAPAANASTATSSLDERMVRDIESILSLSDTAKSKGKLSNSKALFELADEDASDGACGFLQGGTDVFVKRSEPEHVIRRLPNAERPAKVELVVKMPKTDSIKEVDLKIIGVVLSVTTKDYHLRFASPFQKPACRKARWLKDRKALKVVIAEGP